MLPPQVIWPIAILLVVIPYILSSLLKCAKKRARQRHRNMVRAEQFPPGSGNNNNNKDITSTCCSWLDAFFPYISSALEREIIFAKHRAKLSRAKHILLHIAIGLIFYSYSYSILTQNIDKYNSYSFNIIFHLIQLLSLITYFITSLINPGFIQYRSFPSFDDDNNDNEEPNESSPLFNNNNNNQYAHIEPIEIDPDNAPPSFCWRCKFVRPLRSKHDYDTDRCVAVFDHHSPHIGNSIGALNHRYFIFSRLFDSILYILCLYIIIDILIKFGHNQYEDVIGWIIMIIMLIGAAVFIFISVGLSGFHIYLATTNQTTYEMIKPQVNEKTAQLLHELASNEETADIRQGIDFNEGCFKNWISFLKGYLGKTEWFIGLQCVLQDADDSDSSEVVG